MSSALQPGFNSEPQTISLHANAVKYAQIAASVWMGWDYLLTFDREVDFFWYRKWTYYKVIFFMNRYFPLVIVTMWNTSVLLDPEGKDKLELCNVGIRIATIIISVPENIVFHSILLMRINAMYQDNKFIRRSLSALYVASCLTAVITASLGGQGAKFIADPAPGIEVCIFIPKIRYLWARVIPILLFEIVAFSLAARRLWYYVYKTPFRGRSRLMRLLEVMLRDWSIYILLIMPMYLAAVCLEALSPPTLQHLMRSPILCLFSVSGTRMMLNLNETGAEARASLYIDTVEVSDSELSEALPI